MIIGNVTEDDQSARTACHIRQRQVYATLPNDRHRYEIIEGVLYMPPAPNEAHQSASRWFVFYLTTHVHRTGLGRVYSAPFDVELVSLGCGESGRNEVVT